MGQSTIKYIILVFAIIGSALIISLMLPNTAIAKPGCGFPCSNFHCNAGDVTVTQVYVADINNNRNINCQGGTPSSAPFIWMTFTSNAQRYNVIMLVSLYIGDILRLTSWPDDPHYDPNLPLQSGHFTPCGGICILNSISNRAVIDVPLFNIAPWYTCGQSVTFNNFVVSWDANQQGSSNCYQTGNGDPGCGERGTKCWAGQGGSGNVCVKIPPADGITGPHNACGNSILTFTAAPQQLCNNCVTDPICGCAYEYRWSWSNSNPNNYCPPAGTLNSLPYTGSIANLSPTLPGYYSMFLQLVKKYCGDDSSKWYIVNSCASIDDRPVPSATITIIEPKPV